MVERKGSGLAPRIFSTTLICYTVGSSKHVEKLSVSNYGEGAESPLVNIAHGIRVEMAQPLQNWRGVFLRRTAWCPSCPLPSVSLPAETFSDRRSEFAQEFLSQ